MSKYAPIEATSEWPTPDGVQALGIDNQEDIKALLLGRTVEKVADDHLLLDNGTTVKLFGNDGGCACSAGCYDLTELNGVPNVITNVTFDDQPDGDYDQAPCRTCADARCYADGHDNEGRYRIFVYAEDRKINLATFEGSDGNGYYGTGYWLLVRPAAGDSDD